MRYLDVCAGISASTVAWKPLGWEAAAYSEIEAAPRAILAHHYPDTPLHGDFTTIKGDEYGPIDLLVGGTPCQDFSIAGLRAGLDGDRGNLSLEFLRLADRTRPRWLVWENVPGVLSIDGGRAFGAILGGLGELGYGWAYRVLDAQHFGVPQRRRRVFVVGYLGDSRRARAVLFERHSLSGYPAPRREKGAGAAASARRGAAFGGNDTRGPIDVATGLNSHGGPHGGPHGRLDFESETFVATDYSTGMYEQSDIAAPLTTGTDSARSAPLAFSIMPMNSNTDYVGRETDVAQPLMAGGPVGGNQGGDFIAQPIPIDMRQASRGATMTNNRAEGSSGGAPGTGIGEAGDPSPTVSTSHAPAVGIASAVRRLTPRECERLQGFPEIHRELRIVVCSSEEEKRARAAYAERLSPAPILAVSGPVAVNVLIDLELQRVQLLSLGRSIWSASIAELASQSRLSIDPDAFARLLALMHEGVGPTIRAGGAGLVLSTQPSSDPLNGSASVLLCGSEIDALANDAEAFIAALNQCSRFTTSQLGLMPPSLGSIWETLSCCVAAAISGFIPDAIRGACSYELRFTTHRGYTAVPYRKGMMADGPRYKALGNSMAVPVMRWIGERIAAVEGLANAAASDAAVRSAA